MPYSPLTEDELRLLISLLTDPCPVCEAQKRNPPTPYIRRLLAKLSMMLEASRALR